MQINLKNYSMLSIFTYIINYSYPVSAYEQFIFHLFGNELGKCIQ